jgi:ABC-type transport system involved in multi-copper enzyme maturation permease subunit
VSRATTHTELYRPFAGKLSGGSPRWWTLATMEVRAAVRNRLALLILYSMPAIAMIVFSFVVYTRYALLDQPSEGGLGAGMGRMMVLQARILEVRENIVQFCIQVRFFALLATAWYGAGLLAEDLRSGAHQLYFSRPLTRWGYFLGKLAAAAFFGMLAVTLPIVVICFVAAFNSPDWQFLEDDWPLVLRSLGYSLIWVTAVASVVLAASAVAGRKVYALAGAFGFFMITTGIAGVLTAVLEDEAWLMLSPLFAFQAIGDEVMQRSDGGHFSDHVHLAWTCAAVMTGLSLALVAWRLRRVEVVA